LVFFERMLPIIRERVAASTTSATACLTQQAGRAGSTVL
jgi:hypothetical protein